MRSDSFPNGFYCDDSNFGFCFFSEPKFSLKFKTDQEKCWCSFLVLEYKSYNNLLLNHEVICLFYLGLYTAWFMELQIFSTVYYLCIAPHTFRYTTIVCLNKHVYYIFYV